jgi:hypothetical protein
MRSDVRALLRVFAWCCAVTLLVFGILTASALGALNRDTAIWLASVVFLVGAFVVGRLFARGLVTRDRKLDRKAESVCGLESQEGATRGGTP